MCSVWYGMVWYVRTQLHTTNQIIHLSPITKYENVINYKEAKL